uniref:Prolyl 3,4-dihydroxylase TPA1/OFD1 N-terminal domain-containing protein n=1 Tax=Skeletonema marinoi TaxID=267567 RepID=A0A7S2LS65_9STRA|mmetsp:Transcript_28877/g.49161  ORF Transcript_28877/g.49161 Transcript_28877/m.49161 type:complete len:358 (+) Transcript_28877:119-1192(+)
MKMMIYTSLLSIVFYGSLFASASNSSETTIKACVDNEDQTDNTVDPVSGGSSNSNKFTYPKVGDSITSFLNPNLFQDPETIHNIKQQLRAGKPVMIHNAFQPEYAEAMYQDLSSAEGAFELHEYAHEQDDFSCYHYNIYDLQKYTPLMNATLELFNSTATKEFASELSGRRCGGQTWPAASWYKPGSHSLPHSDWADQRTVAYVWHLTKGWKHGWGGHLYWMSETSFPFVPPSFNTLVLFSVNTRTQHMVTSVNHLAGDVKRLTINGWWEDNGWLPSFEDDLAQFAEGYDDWLDYFLEDSARLLEFTADQSFRLGQLQAECAAGGYYDEIRCNKLHYVYETLHEGSYWYNEIHYVEL